MSETNALAYFVTASMIRSIKCFNLDNYRATLVDILETQKIPPFPSVYLTLGSAGAYPRLQTLGEKVF